jgi:cysteine synthase A
VVAVEPKSSPVISGGRPGPHRIQGIGAGFVPSIFNRDIVDEIVQCPDETAIDLAKRLARVEGVLAGMSCGAALYGAIEVGSRPEWDGKRVVLVLPDSGERYVTVPYFQP